MKELNGTLKMNDADLPKNIDEMEVEDSSSSEEVSSKDPGPLMGTG